MTITPVLTLPAAKLHQWCVILNQNPRSCKICVQLGWIAYNVKQPLRWNFSILYHPKSKFFKIFNVNNRTFQSSVQTKIVFLFFSFARSSRAWKQFNKFKFIIIHNPVRGEVNQLMSYKLMHPCNPYSIHESIHTHINIPFGKKEAKISKK